MMNFPRPRPTSAPERLGNFNYLKLLVESHVAPDQKARYLHMLEALKEDQKDGDLTYLGMMRAPAAVKNHHAFEGGLVYHLIEMWNTWIMMRGPTIEEGPFCACAPHITNERVLKAIIHHDLHKAYRTYVLVSQEPWVTKYGLDLSDELLINDVKSMVILSQNRIELDLEQTNALIQAEGGYSKIRPKETTTLAKLCYLLDEYSGNVLAKVAEGTLLGRPKG